ncbi:MAG: hypothetical protein WC514_02515 [Candidatus Paceibacterota bacterium]
MEFDAEALILRRDTINGVKKKFKFTASSIKEAQDAVIKKLRPKWWQRHRHLDWVELFQINPLNGHWFWKNQEWKEIPISHVS